MTKLDELTAEEKQVFWILEFHSPKDECDLQNWEIAKLSGVKRYRISKILKALETKGLIKRRTRVIASPLWDKDQVRAERTIEVRRSR